MHDLNDALDELRHVIPYAHSPSVRKLSKIATLLLAKNYILMQTNALNELRRVLICLHQHSGASLPQALSASVAALLGSSAGLVRPVGQPPGKHESWSPGGATIVTQGPVSANPTPQSSGKATLESADSQMKSGPSIATGSEQHQTTSVQNRRRKYNMLISRILNDVASQHLLVNPLNHMQKQQAILVNSPTANSTVAASPIDFCTQAQAKLNPDKEAGISCRIGEHQRNATKRKLTPPSDAYDRTIKHRKRCHELNDGNLSDSSFSSASGCSSLVSVGSPTHQIKNHQQVDPNRGDTHLQTASRSHSASTIVSCYEETEEQILEDDASATIIHDGLRRAPSKSYEYIGIQSSHDLQSRISFRGQLANSQTTQGIRIERDLNKDHIREVDDSSPGLKVNC